MSQYPLAGYRVIDLGWVVSGPLVSCILGDLGAEVIKVESRQRLDANRRLSRPIKGGQAVFGPGGQEAPADEGELAPLFHQLNRNKLSVTLNLKQPRAVALLKALVKRSNVVVENFGPGVLQEWGLDYEALREVRPDLVMISLTAAGQYGPLAASRAYAPTISSLGGQESLVGYEGEPVLGNLMFGLSDQSAGFHGAMLVLAALYHRRRTGEGQYIDFSQLEAVVSLLGEPILDYFMNGRVAGPQGNRHPTRAPHGIYPCRGEDKWVSIAVGSQEEWQNLCRALGHPAWAKDERFADAFARLRNRKALDRLVAAWTAQHTPEEATQILQEAGVAATPVLTIEEQYADPHFQARGLLVDCHHPLFGSESLFATPWRLSETPQGIHRPAPLLGQHNDYVFGEILDLSEEEIARLEEEKVLY